MQFPQATMNARHLPLLRWRAGRVAQGKRAHPNATIVVLTGMHPRLGSLTVYMSYHKRWNKESNPH